MATFSLIGLYRIIPNMNSLVIAARYLEYNWLINSNNEFTGDIDWDSFKNLGLLELLVSRDYLPGELLNISQNDQAPYLDFYLNEAGIDRISEAEAIANGIFRVCFYLHFIDVSKPLLIGDQEIQLFEMEELPSRLLPFSHYVPVD